MTVTERSMAITPVVAPAFPGRDEPLRVDGVIPAELDGAFVRSGPHPGGDGGSALVSGVRLTGGAAQWLRASGEGVPSRPPAAWRGADGRDGTVSAAPAVRDRITGEWHTVATRPGHGHAGQAGQAGQAEHVVMDADGRVIATRSFPLAGAPLMGAVALTDRYVVVFDLPVVYDHAAALVGARSPYRARPERPARLGLLPRTGGDARWFAIEACQVTQVVNAYDDGPRVVVDAVRHDLPVNGLDGSPTGTAVRRWTLDAVTGDVAARMLAEGLVHGVVDGRLAGRRHQMVFGVTAGGRALAGYDLAAGGARVRELAPGWTAGHAVFAPRGAGEGNGWLIVLATEAARGRAALLVLDALNLGGRPQAVIHLPVAPPPADQAAWVAAPPSARGLVSRNMSTPAA
ncbi:carotenoid 9,10-9',10' cleavage dioxygenase [Sphaerisporangium krabiense]|uniref:Dioxygenase n=1 Tax=Sphaerisporangium krabiense TaxID=763782 RepID=A0A7W8ZC43_9ACTN|nr:carotenoid oxygenase family protein [Sphaerisporangium krabiense]MBB5631279.1 carotenoid cleavage dioxygenase [Sphaerisporangium krabiense]GII61108.1 carotenoid 9,10-9',10' cleavage dioxygenase [Sphaerisporangium krabiense]